MMYLNRLALIVFLTIIINSPSFSSPAKVKRAMTMEDVMNFHHLYNPVISYDGKWVAYTASPDRGDGYGVIVSADKRSEYIIERGVQPEFSSTGHWALFTIKPKLSATEGVPFSQRPKDATLLINTKDGSQTLYPDVRESSFSTSGEFLFIHHHFSEDTTLTKKQNDQLKKAGTPLMVMVPGSKKKTILPFVQSWTVDSLSTTLVYTVKDTLEKNSGLYCILLDNPDASPMVIDTTGKTRYGKFTWYQKGSSLAFMSARDTEKDSVETAIILTWDKYRHSPDTLLTNKDAPEGYFLPFDNRLTWSNDGRRLFFGFRPDEFSNEYSSKKSYVSVLDSIQQKAGVYVWHGDDPLIKSHEKSIWDFTRRQNLTAVYDFDKMEYLQLGDRMITNVSPPLSGEFALGSCNIPYSRRITWEGSFRDIYIINISTGEKKLVVAELDDIALMAPNGNFLLYFRDGDWHAYDTRTGTARNITAGAGVPFYNETNDRPSSPLSYRTAGWVDDGESVLLYDRYDIWKANLRTGKLTSVTGGKGRESQTIFRLRNLDDEPLLKQNAEVLIEGFNENTKVRAVYVSRPDREGIELLRDDGVKTSLRLISGNGKRVVFTRESYNEFPDLWISDRRLKSSPVKLSDLGRQTEPFNWGTSELISFKSEEGVPLQGIVIKPGDYDPSKRYPVFVYYYEKFSHRLHDFNPTVINHRPSFGYYASNGYVLFLPDIHFENSRPGMSAVKSLVPGVEKIIESGIADPQAIGLHGHSWSGYQTAFVVTQTDIFRAAIAGAPVANMTSAYGGIRWGSGLARQFQYETGQSRIGFSLFEQRDLYIENSPLFFANKINTPMMIMHGDADEAVPWEQSIELYLAMRRAGKDVIFLQYKGEPHHPRKYQNKLDYAIRMKEYFDHHLKGFEPADWIINGVPYTGR
jgi:dipeptidyl aminopeptidase/acylaminoacyl peptidase